ncbi:MAG: hypothetical protein OEM93_20130 [Rhodospirillales bacterium]|nr:hypothetical protein [Rhodospirillales bacterium]MDH3968607.1 hypothetical protein [Rhodospirillales bacterium]
MTRALLLLAAIAVLGGCGKERKPAPLMADTCQTTKCVCEPSRVRLFGGPEPVPVLWKATGEAYCPEDYVLRLANKKKK